MTRRLLREPHLLAHELRTPLAILGGWFSLIRDGDVSAQSTPAEWATGMAACREAVDRLNLIINQACDEAETMMRRRQPQYARFAELLARTQSAIDHSRVVLVELQSQRPQAGPAEVMAGAGDAGN